MTPTELRDARRLLGERLGRKELSQAELARALGLAASSGDRMIRHYEKGTKPIGPTIALLIRYFVKFGLPEQAFSVRREP